MQSGGRPAIPRSVPEETTHNFHGLTHLTAHTDLGDGDGADPFQEEAISQVPGVTALNC